MRSLLTSGIKAILAIAALSTAAHWALRVQRESEGAPPPPVASLADPVTTGSITPPVPPRAVAKPVAKPVEAAREAARAATPGLDQSHLAALMASAGTPAKAKVAKR